MSDELILIEERLVALPKGMLLKFQDQKDNNMTPDEIYVELSEAYPNKSGEMQKLRGRISRVNNIRLGTDELLSRAPITVDIKLDYNSRNLFNQKRVIGNDDSIANSIPYRAGLITGISYDTLRLVHQEKIQISRANMAFYNAVTKASQTKIGKASKKISGFVITGAVASWFVSIMLMDAFIRHKQDRDHATKHKQALSARSRR